MSMTGRAVYLIHAIRQVKGRYYPGRWRCRVERVDLTGTRVGPEATYFPLYWHPRGKR